MIHASSPRSRGPFVEVNCAGLTSTFLDSELFGHEKGAFTDARTMRRGLFELADGGILFLDEVGDLAPELQPKLLKVLESRRFRRLGGTREIEVDVCLIAATRKDLEVEVKAGRFREDLYYRLAVLPLRLPSLRDRGITEIAELLHSQLASLWLGLGRGPATFSDEALQLLVGYSWPGNIRELRNLLERALLLAQHAPAVRRRNDPLVADLRRPPAASSRPRLPQATFGRTPSPEPSAAGPSPALCDVRARPRPRSQGGPARWSWPRSPAEAPRFLQARICPCRGIRARSKPRRTSVQVVDYLDRRTEALSRRRGTARWT